MENKKGYSLDPALVPDEELKPCPFCGNAADLCLTMTGNNNGYYVIECSYCHCRTKKCYSGYEYNNMGTSISLDKAKKQAVKRWNRRKAAN